MKAAVIGANGQLGTEIADELRKDGAEVEALVHEDIRIEDPDSVRNRLGAPAPDVVVNTAAMHHVEHCETEPGAAYAVNAIGPRNLARVSAEQGFFLVHISTDYVFNGAKQAPYVEEDAPGPLNVYANTKLAGEYYVLAETSRGLVMRVSGLYGPHPCRAKGLNFVDLMLKLAEEKGEVRVVDNEFLTPTSAREVARQVARVCRSPLYGLCHATAEGACSWYEFAEAIFALSGTPVRLHRAGPNDFPAKVPRPLYTVLENARLKREGCQVLKSWQEGLGEYLEHQGRLKG